VAACTEHGRHIEAVDSACYAHLARHAWPGNVRELRNVVESAVIMATGPVLKPEDLRIGSPAAASSNAWLIPEGKSLADIEKEALLQTLRRFDGNRQLTAEALGLSTRTIQRKIQEYNLPF
jgi:DNA-binding NtrC family response regulator